MIPISKCRYRLTHHSEEFGCPTCGAPVYVGDTAWDDDGEVYCGAYCAGADPGKQQPTTSVMLRLGEGKPLHPASHPVPGAPLVLAWDEPSGAISPRGWLHVTTGHPDAGHRHWAQLGVDTCGWWLDYSDSRPADEPPILARAYVFRIGRGYVDLAPAEWHATAEAAREWIVAKVTAYLGSPD